MIVTTMYDFIDYNIIIMADEKKTQQLLTQDCIVRYYFQVLGFQRFFIVWFYAVQEYDLP